MTEVTKISVYYWHCEKRFYIELDNYYAGKLFCSDKCRIDNLKNEIEIEKMRREVTDGYINKKSGGWEAL